MYPLLELGPLRLSSGGLLLIIAVLIGTWLFERHARQRGGEQLAELARRCASVALLGALVGARLWYGMFSWDVYGRSPGLFLVFRIGDFAWPGALAGGALAGYLWCRHFGVSAVELADAAVLALPIAQVVASIGLLLSGEALGAPTVLPWAVYLSGVARHPTQLYFAAAALVSRALLAWGARSAARPGMLTAFYLGCQGIAMLLIEALRVDSLVVAGGIRVAQVSGLLLLLAALWWQRSHVVAAPS